MSEQTQYPKTEQSSSVTQNGKSYQEDLTHLVDEEIPKAAKNEEKITETKLSVEQLKKRQALLELLDSWCEEDEEEQRETWEYLKRVLDEDRLSYRKLFS